MSHWQILGSIYVYMEFSGNKVVFVFMPECKIVCLCPLLVSTLPLGTE